MLAAQRCLGIVGRRVLDRLACQVERQRRLTRRDRCRRPSGPRLPNMFRSRSSRDSPSHTGAIPVYPCRYRGSFGLGRESVFLGVVLIMTGHAILTPMLMVIIMITGDFLGMSLTTDRVRPSPKPNAWRIRSLTIAGALMGIGELIFVTTILAYGEYAVHMDLMGIASEELGLGFLVRRYPECQHVVGRGYRDESVARPDRARCTRRRCGVRGGHEPTDPAGRSTTVFPSYSLATPPPLPALCSIM
jgi:hypothetical protein